MEDRICAIYIQAQNCQKYGEQIMQYSSLSPYAQLLDIFVGKTKFKPLYNYYIITYEIQYYTKVVQYFK